MPQPFKVGDRIYDIEEDQFEAFKNYYPDAEPATRLRVEDREYVIRNSRINDFYSEYPNAQVVGLEVTGETDIQEPGFESPTIEPQTVEPLSTQTTQPEPGEPQIQVQEQPESLEPLRAQFQGTGNKWVDGILSTVLNISAMPYKIPGMTFDLLYDAAAIPQNLASMALDKPEWYATGEEFRERTKKVNPLSFEVLEEIADAQKQAADYYHGAAFEEFGGKNLLQLLKEDPAVAGEYFLLQVTTLVPQIAEVIGISVLTGNPAIATGLLASQAAASKKLELEATQPDMPDTQQNVDAILTGMVEAVTERMGTERIMRKVLQNEAFRRNFFGSMRRLAKESFVKSPVEGVEELTAGIGGDVVDTITGVNGRSVKELPRLILENRDQYIEQGLLGVAAGSIMVGGTSAIQQRKLGAAFKKSNQNKKDLSQIISQSQSMSDQGFPQDALENLQQVDANDMMIRTRLSEQHYNEFKNYLEATREHIQKQVDRQQSETEQQIRLQIGQAEQLINENQFETAASLINELNQVAEQSYQAGEINDEQLANLQERREIVSTLFEERLNAFQAEEELEREAQEGTPEEAEGVEEGEIAAEDDTAPQRELVMERQDIKGKLYDIYQEPSGRYTLEPRGKGTQQTWTQDQFDDLVRRKEAGQKDHRKRIQDTTRISEEQLESAPALRMIPNLVSEMPQGELEQFQGVMVRNNELTPKDPERFADQIKADQFVFEEMPQDFQDRYPNLRGDDGNLVDAEALLSEALKELRWLQKHPGEPIPSREAIDDEVAQAIEDEFESMSEEERAALEEEPDEQEEVFRFFEQKASERREEQANRILGVEETDESDVEESEEADRAAGDDERGAATGDQPGEAAETTGETVDRAEPPGETDVEPVAEEREPARSRDRVAEATDVLESLRTQQRQVQREVQQAERQGDEERVQALQEQLDELTEELDTMESQRDMLSDVRDINEDLEDIFFSSVYEDSPIESREDLEEEIARLREELSQLDFTEKQRILEDKLRILEELAQETQDGYNPPSPMAAEALTEKGAKILQEIQDDTAGKHIGIRSIVVYINDRLNIDMIVRSEQTSRKHPAHYERSSHTIRTRSDAVQLDFHEQGHAIYEQIIRDDEHFIQGFGEVLKFIGKMDGSYASAHNTHEGFAEWVRRFIVDYNSIRDYNITDFIEGKLQEEYPGIYETLLDARGAYAAHQARSTVARRNSHENDTPPQLQFTKWGRNAWDQFLFSVASGYAYERADRRVFKAMKQAKEDVGATRKQAREFAEQVRKKVENDPANDFRAAHQAVIQIPNEVTEILEGTKSGQAGIRIKDASGEYRYLTDFSWDDIVNDVGLDRWDAFERYAKDKAMLERWESEFLNLNKLQDELPDVYEEYTNNEGVFRESAFAEEMPEVYGEYLEPRQLEYPGRLDGEPPEVLREEIEQFEQDHSDFPQHLTRVNQFFNALLDITVLSGERTEAEAARMKKAYAHYIPLMREIESNTNVTGVSKSAPSSKIRRAGGSWKRVKPLQQQVVERTQNVLSSYYWNRSMQTLIRGMNAYQQQDDIPFFASAEAGRIVRPLRMDTKVVAQLGEEEAQAIKREIAEYLKREGLEENVKPSDIDIAFGGKPIFRKEAPDAIRVIAPFENGQRQYYQINDPIIFDLFAKSGDPVEFWQWYDEILTPPTRAFKRLLTRNFVFALRNLPRDAANAQVMGDDPRGAIPFYYAFHGVMNRVTGKFPEARKSGELFMRSLETSTSEAHKRRRNRFEEVFWEGLEPIEDWKILSWGERSRAMPGLIANVLAKPLDIFLWGTGQTRFSETMEELGREGAAVKAIERGESADRVDLAYNTLTGNFGEHSGFASVRAILKPMAFVNPGLQITYRMYLKGTDPNMETRKRFWVRMGVAVPITMSVVWAFKELVSNDEDREREEERPAEDRAAYMDIKGFRIPFDYGLVGAIQSTTWNLLDEQVAGMEIIDRKKFAKNVLKRVGDFPGHPVDFLEPHIRTLVELNANRSFYFDSYIVPPLLEDLPEEQQAFTSTPEVYKKLGKVLSMSPIKVEYMVKNFGLRQYDEMIDLVKAITDGEEITERREYPFVGRLFIKEPIGSASASVQEVERKNREITDKLKKELGDVVEYDIGEKGIAPIALFQLQKLDEKSTEYRALKNNLMAFFIYDLYGKRLGRKRREINRIQKQHDLERDDVIQIEEIKAEMRQDAQAALRLRDLMETEDEDFLQQWNTWRRQNLDEVNQE